MNGRVIGTAIAVNCFYTTGQAENGIYFLSEGIVKCSLPPHVDKVYTSVHNAKLLQKYSMVDSNRIVKLPLNQKMSIKDEIKGLNFFVTLLDAKQKPGAVMFLFEGSDIGSILYAGMCCYNNKLSFQYLDSALKGVSLDFLYIDDVCEGCYKHSETIDSAVESVVTKIRSNPDCKIFLIEPCQREDLLTMLKNKLKENISISQNVRKHLEELGLSSGYIEDQENVQLFVTDTSKDKCMSRDGQQIIKMILLPCPVTKSVRDIEAHLQKLKMRGYHVFLYRNHCSQPELVSFVKQINAKHTVLIRPKVLDQSAIKIDLDYWSCLGVDFLNNFHTINNYLKRDIEDSSDMCEITVDLLSSVDSHETNSHINQDKCEDTNHSVVSVPSSFASFENDLESLVSKNTVPNIG